MNPINYEWMAVSMAIMWLLLWVEHWFRYPFERHVIFNYCAGVSAILIGITIYCVAEKMIVNIVIVWAFSVAGGIAVASAYGIDWASNLISNIIVALKNKKDEQPKDHD